MSQPPLACAAGACVCRNRSPPSYTSNDSIWLPFGPSLFVETTLGAVLLSVYVYCRSGRVVVGPLVCGLNTLTSRPNASYCSVVVLLLGSTTLTGIPRAPSSVVVVMWPAGL